MNIKRAKQEIKDAIEAYFAKDSYGEYEIPPIRQRPILLLGSPGIGKTQIMEQIARECEVGLVSYTITHHTRQSAIGLPYISQKDFAGRKTSVTEYTMSEIVASVYEQMERTGLKEGILFIDEINCASETLAPAMLQFLQCKMFGTHKIPDGWLIVAAGNPPEYNKSVREFDVVTMDRIRKIEVEADFAVWKEYAYANQLHPAVISYLNTKKQYFYQMETTVDGRIFATPRGWEDLSVLIGSYERRKKRIDREVVAQYIQHEKIAKDFANYLELFDKYRADYQIEEIFQGRLDGDLAKKVAHAPFDERLSVVGLLLSKVNEAIQRATGKKREMETLQECLSKYPDGARNDARPVATENPAGMGSPAAADSPVGVGSPAGTGSPAGADSPAGTGSPAAVSRLEQILAEFDAEATRKKNAQLLSREKERTLRNAREILEGYAQRLRMEGDLGLEEAFGRLKDWFAKENEVYLSLDQEASRALGHAFDFLEMTAMTGQEMVIFITELNSNPENMEFLAECGEERYFQYNQELLFLEKREKILEKLS